ncbi:hypothetical protein ACERK3_11880 [Phycisphaerales bacterium AB-hyl4]|uniref:ATP synthase protein I n=1 Tax=Natronomicrosphaera hydrolytica TaxID=3242702 RepID=A0ABV4U5W9_9BACT
MNAETPTAPAFPVARSITTMLTAMVACVVLAVGVLIALGATQQIAPALAAAAVAMTAGVLALVPMRMARRSPLETAMLLALLGTGIRLVFTLLGLVFLIFVFSFDRAATGLWTLGWYALLLATEVRLLARYFQSVSSPDHRQASHEANDHDPTRNALEKQPC